MNVKQHHSKKVLLVSYDYPPFSSNVGRVRPSKFVKYLPQFGWEPTVLTLQPKTILQTGVQQVDGDIYYAKEWPHPVKMYYWYQEQRARRNGRSEEFALRMGVGDPEAATSKKGAAGLKRLLLDFLSMPDQELGWLVPAIRKGVTLLREKGITHLMTTSPPVTVQLVGLVLKRLTGVRWIADYRDPWSLRHKYVSARNTVTDALELKLIRLVMKHADVIISATPPMTEQYRKEHPTIEPSKFVTLTNGFDPDDFVNLTAMRNPSGRIQFSYVGEFYDGRTPEHFLNALRTLIDDGLIQPREVVARFVGNVAVAEGQSVASMIERFGLKEIVTVEGPVHRDLALDITLASHVLLVLTEKQPHALPFKFYEALGSGGIILNIGCGGAVAEELVRTGRGIGVHYQNLEDIRRGILQCIQLARAQRSMSQPWGHPAIQSFNFNALTGKLATLLDGLGHSFLQTQGVDAE